MLSKPFNNLDVLHILRDYPEHLKEQLSILMVNRQGDSDKSFMQTENFLGCVTGGTDYTLTLDGFIENNTAVINDLPKPTVPEYMVLNGRWEKNIDTNIKQANILGGNGRYILPAGQEFLQIPIAKCTPENLAFYQCRLIGLGDSVHFESDEELPVTVTTIGEEYVDGYLMNEHKGGGSYLEYHDRPHFHMPLNQNAKGYLIIGRKIDGIGTAISAFQIPYKSGIYMAPWCVHSDAYLIGKYMVIYSKTDKFSTVILRTANNQLGKIRFL